MGDWQESGREEQPLYWNTIFFSAISAMEKKQIYRRFIDRAAAVICQRCCVLLPGF